MESLDLDQSPWLTAFTHAMGTELILPIAMFVAQLSCFLTAAFCLNSLEIE